MTTHAMTRKAADLLSDDELLGSDEAFASDAATDSENVIREAFDAALDTAGLDPRARTNRIVQAGIEIEQEVEARYLRVGRSFTYGPVRRLFEEYAAEVRDHARILSRHLRDRKVRPSEVAASGRRRRPRAAEGAPILTPPALYRAFEEAFRAAEQAIVFHRRSMEQVDDRFLRKFMTVLSSDHSFHLDVLGHLLADVRDRPMHLTPGRKLAPIEVEWVAAMFEGVVPPWRRESEAATDQAGRWFINYM
ncbi:MAG: ferritin-like domain-containing protein [Planctomycetota bacterium]|nr:ferritin-like domain-containing protein [Planctomycetota bacterium]